MRKGIWGFNTSAKALWNFHINSFEANWWEREGKGYIFTIPWNLVSSLNEERIQPFTHIYSHPSLSLSHFL